MAKQLGVIFKAVSRASGESPKAAHTLLNGAAETNPCSALNLVVGTQTNNTITDDLVS